MSGDGSPNAWRSFWERGGLPRAVLLAAGYLAIYLAAGLVIGNLLGDQIDVDDLFDSPATVLIAIAAPIVVGIVVLVLFGLSVGWLGELFARQPIGGSWWMWIPPVVVLLFNVLRFVATDYSAYTVGTVIAILFAGLCIGFAEEVLTRGYVVNLIRRGGHGEWLVMVLSSLIFAGLHVSNLLSGMSPVVVAITVGYTFAFGIAMYATLRVTGNLIWPILLHASTDPSLILMSGGIDRVPTEEFSGLAAIAGLGNIAVMLVALIPLIFVRGRIGDVRRSA
jgi:uncharacterized protein